MIDWLEWNLWSKWVFRWKHRNDTREQVRAELLLQWNNVLDAMVDEPEGGELIDAKNSMEEVFARIL